METEQHTRGESSEASWVAALLQLNDTFYPTGAYAHSFGLEGLVAEGVVSDRASLRQYLLCSALPTLARVELPMTLHAWRAFGAQDWPALAKLCELSSALKTAKEARRAADAIGRQRIELCARLRQHPLATELMRRIEQEGWPCSPAVAAALEAKALGAPVAAALAAVYYSTIAGLIAAAMKLLRLGQNGAQTLLTELMSRMEETAAAAGAVSLDEIGWVNPWLDIAAARHESAETRLFIS